MVGFRDLVGVGIAPVSKTTAIKFNLAIEIKIETSTDEKDL